MRTLHAYLEYNSRLPQLEVEADFAQGWGLRMATREEVHEILENVPFRGKFRLTESGWWIAYCEEVPEARTQGETKEEARENLKDAVAFVLEDCSPDELARLRTDLTSQESELLAL